MTRTIKFRFRYSTGICILISACLCVVSTSQDSLAQVSKRVSAAQVVEPIQTFKLSENADGNDDDTNESNESGGNKVGGGGGSPDYQFGKAFMVLTSSSSKKPIDGVTALTILLIGSFVVDRFSTGVLWLLSGWKPWAKSFPNPSTIAVDQPALRAEAQTRLVIVYYAIAIAVAMVLLTFFCDLQLLSALGFEPIFTFWSEGLVDRYITGAIIVIGAERVAHWLQLPGTPGAEEVNVQPVLVAGELVLREPMQVESSTAIEVESSDA